MCEVAGVCLFVGGEGPRSSCVLSCCRAVRAWRRGGARVGQTRTANSAWWVLSAGGADRHTHNTHESSVATGGARHRRRCLLLPLPAQHSRRVVGAVTMKVDESQFVQAAAVALRTAHVKGASACACLPRTPHDASPLCRCWVWTGHTHAHAHQPCTCGVAHRGYVVHRGYGVHAVQHG